MKIHFPLSLETLNGEHIGHTQKWHFQDNSSKRRWHFHKQYLFNLMMAAIYLPF